MARAAQHYRDMAGREVHGLGRRPDGRFYAIKDRNKSFGKDPIQAVRKFRQWEAKQGNLTVQLVDSEPWDLPEDASPALREWKANLPNGNDIIHNPPPKPLWEYVAVEVFKRPNWVADMTGVEQFRSFADLEPPAPSLKLAEVPQIFAGKKKTSDQEKRFAKATWLEFVKVIGKVDTVKTLKEIKQAHVEFYHDWIHEQLDKGKYGPLYINKKMAKIRTVLKYAMSKAADKKELRRVIDLTALFESARLTNGHAKAITIENYHKLLKAAKHTDTVDPELWTALLLFSLNLCATGLDFRCCLPEHIDLDKGTAVYPRPKNTTGGKDIMRVGVLWSRTVKAIRAYQAKHNHGLEFVFANWDCRKKQYSQLSTKSTIGKQFAKIRATAGLPESVKIGGMRKGGYSAALEGKCDSAHAEILMGHTAKGSNVSDDYLERNPKMVADACEAIERHYFGGKK